MTEPQLLTPEELSKIVRYEPNTGKLFWQSRTPDIFPDNPGHSPEWKASNWNAAHAGKEASSRRRDGYITLKIQGRQYRGHRVAWALFHKEWPSSQVDHINGIRDDNRISNLRLATDIDNARNQKLPTTNKSGVVGVSFDKGLGKWVARIGAGDAQGYLYLGSYRTMDEAIAARRAAEKVLNYSTRHGT